MGLGVQDSITDHSNTGHVRYTFSSATKSAACSNVRPEMSSTILFNFGSALLDGGGRGDDDDGVSAVVATDLQTRLFEESALISE